jgi:hypothetical protein
MGKAEGIAQPERMAPPARRYTLSGDAEVEARIEADQRLIADAVTGLVPAKRFVALVLIGAYGCGEGGYVHGEQGPAPAGDYDYSIVVRRMSARERAALQGRLAKLAEALTARVGAVVNFAVLGFGRLKRAERSLMNAEMLWGHRVIAGDPDVLAAMPDVAFERLRQGEVTRLMLNRGALLLMDEQKLFERRTLRAGPGAGGGLDAAEREVFFQYLFQAVLACGDTRLAAIGQYHPSYPEKLKRLEAPRPAVYIDEAERPDPMPLHDEFLHLYRLAYRHRFHPAYEEFAEARPADWLARVLRIWTSTLRAFELRRLGRGFADWRDYCRAELPKGQNGNLVRNLFLSLREFGLSEIWRRPGRTLRYPRERLIGSLPLLLTESGSLLDPCAASALGLPANVHWKPAAQRFLDLWGRYA